MKPESVIEWIGALLVLSAFMLITFGVWVSADRAYLLFNGVGSICICYGAYKKKDLPPVFLNVVWLLVALIALARTFL